VVSRNEFQRRRWRWYVPVKRSPHTRLHVERRRPLLTSLLPTVRTPDFTGYKQFSLQFSSFPINCCAIEHRAETASSHWTRTYIIRQIISGEWGGRDMWHAWKRREKCKRFWWESLKERDHLEDQGVDERMGSEWILGRLAADCWMDPTGSW
jgi:hypothetical protein